MVYPYNSVEGNGSEKHGVTLARCDTLARFDTLARSDTLVRCDTVALRQFSME